MMNALVVGLDGDGFDDLSLEGDADALCFALRMGEKSVVVTAAAAKTESVAGEGEAGNEDEVESGDFDGLAVRFRLPDVHLAALEVIHAFDLARTEFARVDLEAC